MRTFLKARKLRFNQLTAEQFFMETLTRGLIKTQLLTCMCSIFRLLLIKLSAAGI